MCTITGYSKISDLQECLVLGPHTLQPSSPSLLASASRQTWVEILERLIKPQTPVPRLP